MNKLPCPPELWPAFSDLLDEALDLPEDARQGWLGALGPEHDAVRPWLARVLATSQDTLSSDFLLAPALREADDSEFQAGARVGPYQLQRRLGRGGMGEVWLATRADGSLERPVALKLPHTELLSGVQRRRFERERDILATLSHPNIAPLYDAGVADSQHPYLAMECVDGVPIAQFCREHKLTLNARLNLFLQVLDAVGYAHERLIAHRDLKPSNILVTPESQVKLLDFGIAKLLNGDTGGAATELTQLGGRAATPDYAAPEQLAGEPITVAVDFYALGVILFELLSGRRPSRLPAAGLHNDTPRASAQLRPEHAAEVSGLDARQLRRALSGDLDAIIAKALEPDPGKRYRSADAFAADLEASREHRPISARRISTWSLAFKFVRRHRIGVALATALLVTLAAGSAGISWQAYRAQRQAERATAIKEFLVDMFTASDPRIASDKPRGTITARELLDSRSNEIEDAFADDSETMIELLGTITEIYRELGEDERYKKLHQRYSELALARYGPYHPIVISALLEEADSASSQGEYDETNRLLDLVDERLNIAKQNQTGLRARWWLQRSLALKQDYYSRSERVVALDTAIQLFFDYAPNEPNLVGSLQERGFLFLNEMDSENAQEYFQRALEVAKNLPDHVDGMRQTIYEGLARAQDALGQFDAAENSYKSAVDLARKTYGENNWRYWKITTQYARMLHGQGKREKALAIFNDLVKITSDIPDGDQSANGDFANLVRTQLARCLISEGQPETAIPLLERAESRYIKTTISDSDLVRVRLVLGDAYLQAGRLDDAEQLLRQALNEFQRRGPENNPELLLARERWGMLQLKRNAPSEAHKQFVAILKESSNSSPIYSALANRGLAYVAILELNSDNALIFSKRALDSLKAMRESYNVRIDSDLWRLRAEALLLSDNRKEAAIWAQKALNADKKHNAPSSIKLQRDLELLSLATNQK